MEVYRKAKPKYAFKMKTDEKCQNIQVLVNIVVWWKLKARSIVWIV